MDNIPEWLVRYAENFVREKGYDSSHDITHFSNVVNYVKLIIDYEKEKGRWTKEDTEFEEMMYIAAFCHDLIDGKYVDPISSTQSLITLFKDNNYPNDKLEVILYIIQNMSFSKQRKRVISLELKEEKEGKYEKYLNIVSDADKLDAYRVERVVAFQESRNTDENISKGWIKTILVKRILEYKDKWLKTEYAKLIAPPLHDKVQEYVDIHLKDVSMFDY